MKGGINMIKVAPSILSADFSRLGEEIKAISEAGAHYIHIDVMDGHFVPNLTLGPAIVNSIRKYSDKVFDVHLMMEKPERYIKNFVDAGADIIVVHVEACPHLHRVIQEIKSYGVKAGVSLNPHTPVEMIKHLIPELDMVLIMSVNPGFGGQKFIDTAVRKVESLKNEINRRGLKTLVEVDGGVNDKNAGMLRDAGADVLVAGSYVFGSDDYKKAIDSLR